MSEICPNCNGAGGDNNTWTCGMCNGSGGVPRPQPSAEPVAYLYEREGCRPYVTANRQQQWVESGSTEEALVRASALEAARREALEQAAVFVETHTNDYSSGRVVPASPHLVSESTKATAAAIRALKENTNG